MNDNADNIFSVIVYPGESASGNKRCLEAIAKQSALPDEVILISREENPQTEQRGFSIPIHTIPLNPGSPLDTLRQAIEIAQGDRIALLSDDCIPEEDWVKETRKALSQIDALTGAILPDADQAFPGWWHAGLNWLVGLSELGELDPLGKRVFHWPRGNFAARRETFELFDGPDSEQGSLNEVLSRFWLQLRRSRFRARYDPGCRVCRRVTKSDFQWRNLFRAAWLDGRTYWEQAKKGNVYYFADRAVRDVLTTGVRWVRHATRKDSPGIRAEFSHSHFWFLRHAGYLCSMASTSPRVKNSRQILSLILRRSPRVLWEETVRLIDAAFLLLRRIRQDGQTIPSKPKSLLVVCLGFLGDMIMIEPACRAFKKANPDCRMVLLTHPSGKTLHQSVDCWDDIIAFEKKGSPAQVPLDFEAAAIPYYHRYSPKLVSILTQHIPCVTFEGQVGFPKKTCYDMCARHIPKDESRNEVETIATLFETLGPIAPLEPYRWSFSSEEREEALEIFQSRGYDPKKSILAHIGSGYKDKCWPDEHWIEFFQRAIRELGRQVIIISGPDEFDCAEKIVAAAGSGAFNGCRLTSQRQLAALLMQAPLLVTGDSGPKHLAFVGETPTISLYGPTDELRWDAFWNTERHHVIRFGNFDLTREERCGLPKDYLMRNISPDEVFELAKKILSS